MIILKNINNKLNIYLFLSIIFIVFFSLQLNALFNINVIEHHVSAFPFLLLILVTFILLLLFMLVIYCLPIFCIVKISFNLSIPKITYEANDFIIKIKVIQITKNIQKNYCVYRC